jgi:hypothetical protein
VLAGIGGRTVAEAKAALQYGEFLDWLTYRNMRGNFNIGSRLESGVALLAWLVNNGLGGKATQRDYMPHADAEEQPAPATALGDVMAILGGKRR